MLCFKRLIFVIILQRDDDIRLNGRLNAIIFIVAYVIITHYS